MSQTPDSNTPGDDPGQPSQARPPIDPAGVIGPPPPPVGYAPPYSAAPFPPPKRGGIVGRIVTAVASSLLLLSIAMNLYLGAWFVASMSGPNELPYEPGDKKHRVVILPVKGMINSQTADFIHQALRALRKKKPKAVVLRIDSGGGGVAASDRIWHDIVTFMEQTQVPVVASFGSVAASGGYYIAAPADWIIAEPTSITGSIGVIAQGFTVGELLQKIGVKPELITATQATKKDMLNPVRDWTEEDRQAMRAILDHAYEQFVSVVARGRRGLSIEEVRALATGEVYTSNQAQENNLVDALGYLGDAIEKAKGLAGIDPDVDPQVTVMSPPRGLGLLGGVGTTVPDPESISGQTIRRWLGELRTMRLEYRWVY